MRRRRERGTLAALLPILVLVGLAQGVEAKHDGEKYHRRSRTRGPMERQIGVDVGLLGSDVLSIDLLGSVTSTSQSPSLSSASAAAQTSSVAAAAAVVSSVSSDSAVSSTTSSTTSTSSVSISSSVAELSHSASSAFTGEPSSSASPSANLFSLNAVSPSATSILESVSASVMASSSAISVSDSSYSSPILTTGGYVRPNTPGQPSATSTPVLSDQVPDAVQPSNSGISGQTISSGQALVSAVSSSAVAVPSVPGNADVSVNSRPPTTLIGATQSINIVGPGASEAVSSSVVGIPMPAETSSPAQITAQPSFSSVSVDFKPPTTIMPSASAVEPVQSVPAQVAPSSSVSIAQPIISAEPAVKVSSSASVRFEQPSVVVEPSSFSVASTTRVDAQPTFPPVQISESSSVNAPTSGTPEVTFQPPTPSSSRFEPEIPPSPTSSSAQVVEPSSQSHSTVHEPSPSEVVVQPSTPASESSTTSAPNRPSESSSVDPRPSSSEVVNQPSPPAASDVATSSAGRPAESSSLHAQPSISTGSASPSIAGPTISASSAAPSASSSAFVEQASSDVVSSSYSSEAWAAPSSSKSSTKEDIYVPTQTWLIMAPSASSASSVSTITPTTTRLSQTGSSSTTQLPSTAVIPNSVPTLIVPANSAANKQYAGTGSDEDPLKDTTLISLLLAADQYPWTFVVKSADATSQLFNTFPKLVSGALQVPESDVQTYGLQVYQPASWNGDQADLLTQWLAYIPEDKFAELNAYLKAGLVSNSPLFNQTGIQGALAAQINTAFPLAANSDTAPTATSTKDSDGDDTRTRDIIIGVCVGIGGLLWIGLVFWIYKRIKRNNDRAVHKRLSEHMSMFDEREREQRRFSTAPSLAPSDIDDRPSSFYASPLENDPVFRRQQRRSLDGDSGRYDGSFVGSGSGLGDHSPTYHPSVFGQSWFANPQGQQMRQTQPQNPFEDIVTRSYLNTSGSAKGLSGMAQRRSGPGRPVHKAMIGQPTLHASSLEFREQ